MMASELTAAQRLSHSRQAIAEQLNRNAGHQRGADTHADERADTGTQESSSHARAPASWWSAATDVIGAWWKYHPAHIALELATPMVSRHIREKPVQSLALATAAGALVAFARPWRVVSITGLAFALLKSSRLPGTLLTLLATHGSQPQQQHPPPE